MMNATQKQFDLEKRTSNFGESIIIFCKSIPYTIITRPLISQLVRSGTSVGANYMEANGASSKKDFRNKIYICKKEIQETEHWLHMLRIASPEITDRLDILFKETRELTLIFGKILSTLKNNSLTH